MAGAYVAKPTPKVVPDIPPDWNPIWPYPGPNPPGYTPSYSLSFTTPASVDVGDTISVSAAFYDHGSYGTEEPDGPLLVTADIDGEPLLLLENKDDGYKGEVELGFSSTDGIWKGLGSLKFQLSDESVGKTVTITATAIYNGKVYTKTNSISVSVSIGLRYTVTATLDWADRYEWLNLFCDIKNHDNTYSGYLDIDHSAHPEKVSYVGTSGMWFRFWYERLYDWPNGVVTVAQVIITNNGSNVIYINGNELAPGADYIDTIQVGYREDILDPPPFLGGTIISVSGNPS